MPQDSERARSPFLAALDVRSRRLRRAYRVLAPTGQAVRNGWRRLERGGRLRIGGFGLFGAAVCLAIFVFFHRSLNYFLAFPDFGPILTAKLLGMLFLAFFAILLFSNVVTALSTFFLSPDLDRLVAAPLPAELLFYTRLGRTVAESSWMVAVFAVPAFLAYGTAHHCGPTYYLTTMAVLPPFVIIPAAIGVSVTAALVNLLPARRTRDFLLILSVVAVAVLYAWLRVLQPERLVRPEGFASFAHFLADLDTPKYSLLPSTWASEALVPHLGGRGGNAVFPLVLLYVTAAAFTLACEEVLAHLFLPGLSRAQEGRTARVPEGPIWERLLRALTLPLARHTRLLILKDVRTFVRDSAQWSQLILLVALVFVYVYNFSVLPLDAGPLVGFYFTNAVGFLNLALAGFVTAAVAARLVYPSISLEGRAFWVTRSAPLPVRRIWWSKFWVGFLPLLVLGQALVIASNHYLRVMPFMTWLAIATQAGMTVAVVALALAVGAAYPRFDCDNAATISAGFGGLLYMALCLAFIAAVVSLEAWPVYAIFVSRLRATELSAGEWGGIALSLAVAVALAIGVFLVSARSGIRRLAEMET